MMTPRPPALPRPRSRGLYAITALTMVGILFGPVAFGATQAWSMAVLELIAAALGVLWLVSCPKDRRILIPLSALAVVGALQLVPLPGPVLSILSPLSSEARDLLNGAEAGGACACISVDAGATLSAIRRVFLSAMVVAAVAGVTRARRYARLLAGTVGIVGAIVIALGLAFAHGRPYTALGFHDMTGPIRPWKSPLIGPLHSAGMGYPDVVKTGKVSHVADAPVVGDVFGPYVNSNHFAGCVALTVPIGAGLLVGLARGWKTRRRKVLLGVAIGLAAGAAITVAFGARSLAGVLALVTGALMAGYIGIPSRLLKAFLGFALAALIAVSVGLPPLLAGSEPADDTRPALLRRLTSSAARRLEAQRAAAGMLRSAPVLGIGLGAYGAAYHAFAETPPILYYAHNDYVQLVAEAGVIGLMAGAFIVGWLLWRIVGALRREHDVVDRALNAGMIGSIAAISFHSFFDYNLHVPANAFLFAVILGLLLRRGPRDGEVDGCDEPAVKRNPIATGLTVCVALALLYCSQATVREALADRAIRPLRKALVASRSRPDPLESRAGDGRLREALSSAEFAATLCPLNAEYARPSAGLRKADDWLKLSLSLCPVNRYARATRREIRRELPPKPSQRAISR